MPRAKITGYLAVIIDISKRKKAEINLKNQIIFSQQIFQSIPEMIIIVDRRLRITFINKTGPRLIVKTGTDSRHRPEPEPDSEQNRHRKRLRRTGAQCH